MKVNLKTNSVMLAVGFINIIILFTIAIRRVNAFTMDSHVRFTIGIIADVTFLLLLFYLTVLLKFAKEEQYIITGFYAFIFINLLNTIRIYIPVLHYNQFPFQAIFGFIITFFTISTIIFSLLIKNTVLRFPFRIHGFAYILLLMIDFGVPIVFQLLQFDDYHIITRLMAFTKPIPIFAIMYVTYKSNGLLKTPDEPIYVRPIIDE